MPLISELPSCEEKKLIKKSFCYGTQGSRNKCLAIKKYVYGLVDALRKWYNRIKPLLLSVRLKMSKGDPSIFYCYSDKVPQALIAIFLDDFLWSGKNEFQTYYISKLCKNFVIGEESHCFSTFRFTPRRK